MRAENITFKLSIYFLLISRRYISCYNSLFSAYRKNQTKHHLRNHKNVFIQVYVLSYHQRKGALFSFSVDTCVDERQRVYLSTISTAKKQLTTNVIWEKKLLWKTFCDKRKIECLILQTLEYKVCLWLTVSQIGSNISSLTLQESAGWSNGTTYR